MTVSYIPRGVCSRRFDIELDDNRVITKLSILGGCSGNLQGIASLVTGMRAEEAVEKLKGIRCDLKATSCPDQLARALAAALDNEM